MARPSEYSPEVQKRGVRPVLEQTEAQRSRWGSVRAIVLKIACSLETLRKWVEASRKARKTRALPASDSIDQDPGHLSYSRDAPISNPLLPHRLAAVSLDGTHYEAWKGF